MKIALYGTGRAAGALGLAFVDAGHSIVDIDGRSSDGVEALTELVGIRVGEPDLLVIAVSDDAIESVALLLAAKDARVDAVHVSGAVSIDALAPLAGPGVQVGSFHPLQTLPDARNGADRLPGSWIGITADSPLRERLIELASSIGCRSFAIDDAAKPLYHAAAAATANFTLAVLDLARDLFEAAGVPFETARPLLEATVANAFELGPRDALTGPIARGDVDTVARQLDAVRDTVDTRAEDFVSLARFTARTAGTEDRFGEVLR
jgi:predicted short-subunit dehydrogenase-like oxidoreductase (DUF2520 family)